MTCGGAHSATNAGLGKFSSITKINCAHSQDAAIADPRNSTGDRTAEYNKLGKI